MQQVEHRIFLTTSLVASRGIDGATTGNASRGTLVPHLAHRTMSHLIDLVEICTGVATDEQHAEQIVDVADVIDVQRIDDLHTIDDHIISIELRLQGLTGEAPHTFVILHEIRHTRSVELAIIFDFDFLRRQKIASDLYLLSLGGNQIKGDGVISVHHRRSHLRTLSPTQVLLCLCCHTHQAEGSHYEKFLHS